MTMNEPTQHETAHHQAKPWDSLIKMANEIASNIAPGQSQEQAVNAMADHLTRFWARSMKKQIIECLEMDDHGLQPTAVQAIQLLKESRIKSE